MHSGLSRCHCVLTRLARIACFFLFGVAALEASGNDEAFEEAYDVPDGPAGLPRKMSLDRLPYDVAHASSANISGNDLAGLDWPGFRSARLARERDQMSIEMAPHYIEFLENMKGLEMARREACEGFLDSTGRLKADMFPSKVQYEYPNLTTLVRRARPQ